MDSKALVDSGNCLVPFSFDISLASQNTTVVVQLENLTNIGISQREATSGGAPGEDEEEQEEGAEAHEEVERIESKYLEETNAEKQAAAKAALLEKNRMLKFLLTDGVHYIVAVEME